MSLNLMSQAAQRKRIEELLANPVKLADEIESLRQQLAEKDAEIERLKTECLNWKNCWDGGLTNQIENERDKLREQLPAMIAKAVEVMRERCAEAVATMHCEGGMLLEDAPEVIRDLPDVTLEDLK